MVIRRSLSWARPQGGEISPRYFPPKNKAGRRTISIPALLVAELKHWKLQCPISERRSGIYDGRRKADAAREDAPDAVLPCPCTCEAAARNLPHSPP